MITVGGTTFIRAYVPLRPMILQACVALLSNEMEVEDVTQDMLLKLWEQRAHLDEVVSPKAYAVCITRNKCIDTLRAPVQRLHNVREPTELGMPLVTTTPREDPIAQGQLTRINGWIVTLPEQQQEAWRPRQEMMLTNDRTAQRMGLRKVTVRSMISRPRKETQELFAGIWE